MMHRTDDIIECNSDHAGRWPCQPDPCRWLPAVWLVLVLWAVSAQAIDRIDIRIGSLETEQGVIEDVDVSATLVVDRDHFRVQGQAKVLGQPASVSGTLAQQEWQAAVDLVLPVQGLNTHWQQFTGEPADWQVQGKTRVQARAHGDLAEPWRQLHFEVTSQGWNADIPQAMFASEDAVFQLTGHVRPAGEGFAGELTLSFQQGLVAVQDLLLEPLQGPITVAGRFAYQGGRLAFGNGKLYDPGGLEVVVPKAVVMTGQEQPLQWLDAEIRTARFPHVFTAWAQGLLYDTMLSEAETEGELTGTLSLRNGNLDTVAVALKDFSLADKHGRFALYRSNGSFNTDGDWQQGRLALDWQAAELYRLDLGRSGLVFDIQDGHAGLRSPFELPIYDGALKVFDVSLDRIAQADMAVRFDGVLTPVSLSDISAALGWPHFSGTLSGVIPGIRYEKGHVKVDGVLLARAFDGALRIRELEIDHLLGLVPHLSASVELENLDLQKLTSTFDFGRIEGRLSGYVNGLEMAAWKPSRFDAYFATPEDDDSRHKISQRAVDNLTSLSGSGIGSALSRTYLRFLENFSYERIGLGCRLENEVCYMRGVAPAKNGSGYYIVKSGLFPPRIDIIGYSSAVDWQELVTRLKRVSSDNAPMIQ